MLDQVGELRVSEQGRDHRVDVVDRSLGEVALAIGPQLVEQVDHVACTDLHQQQLAEFGQHVVLEPALVVLPVEATLATLGDPDEVRHLPAQERMDVLEGVLELVVPPVSAEQEQGLVDALDEADRGELVDGPEAIANQRRRVRGAR